MNAAQSARLDRILDDLIAERGRQLAKWGEQSHRNGTGWARDAGRAREARFMCDQAASIGLLTWRHVLDEEVCEAFAETDHAKLRAELVQVAAVCAAWIDCLDRTATTNDARRAEHNERTPAA
ncbi:MAG TPA: hypothetical protein VFL65_00710 [Jatrophihabitans sp.]|nr:hypothetical protein [Jatrophihabitans sp.]